MKFVGWDESDTKPKGHMFLRLEPGKEYRIRLVKYPYQYFQVWEPFPYRSPYMDATGKIIDPLMIADPEIKVKERYSCWCIDRSDGKFKIVDFTPTLKNKFSMWKKNFNDEPGGPKGPDWSITSTGTGINTKWEAMPLDRTPLTAEEMAFVQSNELKKTLEDVRKPDTPEDIRTRYENYQSKGQTTKPQKTSGQTQAVPPAAASVQAARPTLPPAAPPVAPAVAEQAAKQDDAFPW